MYVRYKDKQGEAGAGQRGRRTMINAEIVDSVDVSDVCTDFDRVTLHRDGQNYHAAPFIDEEHGSREVAADLTEYPAVVAIAKRAFETDRPVRFDAAEPITAAFEVSDDVD